MPRLARARSRRWSCRLRGETAGPAPEPRNSTLCERFRHRSRPAALGSQEFCRSIDHLARQDLGLGETTITIAIAAVFRGASPGRRRPVFSFAEHRFPAALAEQAV